MGGQPWVYVERGGKSLATFAVDASSWASALAEAVVGGAISGLEIARIDGIPAGESGAPEHLLAAGFTRGYKGFVLRPKRGSGRAHERGTS